MFTFTPHHLVHAHLPAPPSIPNSIPELRVPTDRPFPEDLSLTSDPNHPDHAVTFSHHPNILVRVIHNGYTLELRALEFVINLDPKSSTGSEIVRIAFPDPIRPLGDDCIIVSHNRIYVFALSESNVLYRLQFPGNVERARRFAFTTSGDWCEDLEMTDEILNACGGISAWTVVDEETVVLGGYDGGTVRLARGKNGWTSHHNRVSSRFRLPSLFSSTNSNEQVVSFARYDRTLYSLSRDRKLRVWTNGSLLKTIDIQSSSRDLVRTSPSSGPSTISYAKVPSIRIVPHPLASSRYSHLIVIYAPGTALGSFIVYRVSKSNQGDISVAGERPCSSYSSTCDLRGFELVTSGDEWRLWVAWDNQGAASCEDIVMDDIFNFTHQAEQYPHDWQTISQDDQVEQYDAAYFDNLLSSSPPEPTEPYENSDIPNTFIDHLFYPGRFSMLTLSTALEEYIGLLPPGTPAQAYPSLAKEFIGFVGSDLEMTRSPQTGAPEVEIYRNKLKLQWLGVWASVRDLDRQARWPVGTTVVDDLFIVITREGISAPVPEDTCSFVERLGRIGEPLNVPDTSLALHPALEPPLARGNILAVSTAGAHISSTMKSHAEEYGTCLDVFTDQVDSVMSRAPDRPVENVAGEFWDDLIEPCLTEEDQMSIRRLLSECPDLARGLSETLAVLVPVDNKSANTKLNFSGYANALITSSIASSISARYALARNTLLVAIFHLSETQSSDNDEDEDLIHLLARAFAFYQQCRVQKWLSEQTAERDLSRGTKRNGDLLAEGIWELRMEGEDMESDGFETSYSLVHYLLAHSHMEPVSTISQASTAFIGSTWSLSAGEYDFEPSGNEVQLAFAILQGHPELARAFTRLFTLSSGLAYVCGRACMEIGDLEESIRLLRQAASGYQGGLANQGLLMTDRSLKRITSAMSNVGEYYRHVTQLYENKGLARPVVIFGQLAIHVSRDDPSSREFWTKIFLANLSLDAYEEAYIVLTSMSSLELRRDYLGQLISRMCENNKIGQLNDFGFVGLHKEVESMLEFKAKHSDPLRFPNYYKILYMWHIARGNYRNAGEIMYLQARRLGESKRTNIMPFELTVMQGRSFLAAINALTLCDKRNAWVPLPVSKHALQRVVERRRMTAYIPEDEFSAKQRIELITLEDIRAEYGAVLARLHLHRHVPDILGQGQITMAPTELIGMLLQRGMYDEAQSAAATLGVDMTDLFISLATRCVQLSRLSDIPSIATASFLYTSPVTSRLRGPPAALALRYLQSALTRHDSARTHYRYREAVADTLFELNRDRSNGWQMPAWLVDWEMDRDPEGWISRALRWGWVSEAVEWCTEVLRRATPPELLPPGKADAAYVPYNLIDEVVVAAQEGDEKDDKRLQVKVKGLRGNVEKRLAVLRRG